MEFRRNDKVKLIGEETGGKNAKFYLERSSIVS